MPPALGGSSSGGEGTAVGEFPTADTAGSEQQRLQEKYYEIVKRTEEVPPIIAKQVSWTCRAMRTLKPKVIQVDEYTAPVTFHAESDTKNWNDAGNRRIQVIKAPGVITISSSDSDSSRSSDLMAPGVSRAGPARRKLPAIPKFGNIRGLDIQLSSLSISSRTEPASSAAAGVEFGTQSGRGTKRSRGDAGRPTPRPQGTDAEVAAAQAYREERERVAMRDARERIKYKHYSARTQEMASAIEQRTGNNPNMPGMIEDMHNADEPQLAVVAAPSSSSGGPDAPAAQPVLPLQGTSDVVQDVMHAATIHQQQFSYYANLQLAMAGGSMTGPPADPSRAWNLLGMGLADRMMLNLTAMDALTRRFRERMAANLMAHSVAPERLSEMQLGPQPPPVSEAVEGMVSSILEHEVVEL